MAYKEISRGAEAIIYLEDKPKKIIKDRVKKGYRIEKLDNSLRKFRTKREAKILEKMHALGFTSPDLIITDAKEKIEMEYIEGPKLRDALNKSNYKSLCSTLGKKIRLLHDHHIIHGDLTTSNFILGKKDNEIYFIDFGLSFISQKVEDMAVDLHLLRQALESKHFEFWEPAFKEVLKAYNNKEVEKRLEKVEARGRNKH